MGRPKADRNQSYHDDPFEYFRRLQSYAPARADAYANSSADLFTPSRPDLYEPSRPEPARPRRDSHSRPKTYRTDSRPQIDSNPRSESYQAVSRPRRESHSRSESYESTSRPRRESQSRSESYESISRPRRESQSRSKTYESTPHARHESHSRPAPDQTPSKSRDDSDIDASPKKQSRPKGQRARPESDLSFSTESKSSYRPDSYASSRVDSYYDDRSLDYASEKRSTRRHKSSHHRNPFLEAPKQKWWTKKRKIIVFSTLAVVLSIIIFTAIGVAVKKGGGFKYTPSTAQVTNEKSFETGGATHVSPDNTTDGIGMGQDVYRYYQGGPQNFPPSSYWVDFEVMWQTNLPNIQKSCHWLHMGEDNTLEESQMIYNAVQDRANASLVDHRFILAIILQESHGCIRVTHTTSSGGVTNPGLMQSYEGDSFVPAHPEQSILLMVQDGTQGTEKGDGLVQNLNRYGDPYSASRGYNSGHIAPSGDLSDAAGATACYVSDIANRLTGWVNAQSTCPDIQY